MAENTTYYWRIDEVKPNGGTDQRQSLELHNQRSASLPEQRLSR